MNQENNTPGTSQAPSAPETVTTAAPAVETATTPSTSIDDVKGISFGGLPHNVTIERPTVKPGKAPVNEELSVPPAPLSTQEEVLRTMPNLRDVTEESDVEWGRTLLHSNSMSPILADGNLEDIFSREGSDWGQGIKVNGDTLRSRVPTFPRVENAKVTGDQAIQLAYSHMQMGDIFHAAMWNSGFWVSFKPAPEPVWMTINRMLGNETLRVDRKTYGLLHSNATALTISTIINAILPYVYSTSVNPSEMPITSLAEHLSNLDEHDFIWGFIAANYPNGFNIERPCEVDPSKCRTVIKETLNVQELQIVDKEKLPEPCRNHMRQRQAGQMSLKSVIEYQERLQQAMDSVVVIKGQSGQEASIVFSVPSSIKKARMSDAYADDIQESVIKAVTSKAPAAQRPAVYEEFATATEMRMYQHWVKEIRIGTNVIEGERDIANILGAWTRDSDMRIQFFKEISSFIKKCSFTAIGLEAAKCPACGADHSNPEQKLRGRIDYIPLDVVMLFSSLAEFKSRLNSARV